MAKPVPDVGIAIFIDFENLVTRTGLTDETFDLQPALDKLAERGRVVFQRAYCDWERFPAARKGLHEKGVELIDVPPSTRSGKNGADIRLVVDALELAYLRPHVHTFVIMSGDSDFCPLAYKLRENNRGVIGMSLRDSTSPLFVKACDEFIYLKPKAPARRTRGAAARAGTAAAPAPIAPPREEETTAAPTRPARPKRTRRGSRAAAAVAAPPPPPVVAPPPPRPPQSGRSNQQAKPPRVVPPLAREVVTAMLAKATGPVNPSAIKAAIVRREPGFDVRQYGFSTFGRLIEALEAEGSLRRQETTGGHWDVVPVG
jgi:uncharacterized LabA/DUF88 family protein